jgi:two-component system response regulator AtoC
MQVDKEGMHVLVIDDDPQVRGFIGAALNDAWEVSHAESAERAFEMIGEREWSLVICDVLMGGADGFQVLRRFKRELPDVQFVLITGVGSASGAMDATAFGAFDHLLKPFGVEDLKSLAGDVRERLANNSNKRNGGKKGKGDKADPFDLGLVGCSRAFLEIMKQVGRVAPTDLPVLLAGESGTGKELVACALHLRSGRADKPFVAVNCGAIPAELIESELFGHVRGAFTGAGRDRMGLFEEADGGTIFLDEVTETSRAFQVKLLRVLQEGEIRRVGSNRTQKVNVRVIAASNRDVEKEIEAGSFRQDLFYRLNAMTICLPPLRERREDIVPLARYFAGRPWTLDPKVVFSPEVIDLLEQYEWPGNIRELENAVVRASALCGGVVRPGDLPAHILNFRPSPVAVGEQATVPDAKVIEEWLSLSEVEGRYAGRVLQRTGGNKQAAARILNVDRKRVDRIIKRHNLAVLKSKQAAPKTA